MANQLLQLVRLGASLPFELRRPVSTSNARTLVQQRLEARDANFLSFARALVYDVRHSPFLKLLRWAGCEWADMEAIVRANGVDGALEQLRDAGVYLTLEEFKRQMPVVRNGLAFEPAESDFDNPLLTRNAIAGTTSGSRARAVRVTYTWPFISEESAHEQLLYDMHGVARAPVALWYPAPPGVAGVHNLLMDLKRGVAPERWFSQVDPSQSRMSFGTRIALPAIRAGARLAGRNAPQPQFADLESADIVLDWLRAGSLLRTFASSAVRLAERAIERGTDLRGVVIFTGGEPLTDTRRMIIERAGATVFPRYVVTEAGLVGGGCTQPTSSDDMHVYTSRVALIKREQDLLLSTLSLHTPKVLLNTCLGDTGTIESRTCACELGRLGFSTHVSMVRSQKRLTLEGMTVSIADFDAALASVLHSTQLRSDRVQYRCQSDSSGIERLIVSIDTNFPGEVNAEHVVSAVYDAMLSQSAAMHLAASIWRQSGTVQAVRENLDASANGKRPLHARSATDTRR